MADLLDANRKGAFTDLGEDQFVSFGSGRKCGELSNFAEVDTPFECRSMKWKSSEHAFQAILRVDESQWSRFAVKGDLSDLEGLKLVYKEEELEKKKKHWGPKTTGKPAMIGIVAKMAVKANIAKKISLKLKTNSEELHSNDEMAGLFVEILKAKYQGNPRFMEILL